MNAVVVSMLLLVVACGDVVGSVTVTINRTGVGEIDASGGTLQCNGTTCTMTVVEGTTVTLTPTAARGTRFEGWSGGACSGTAPCTFTADADLTLSAAFAVARVTLTVTTTPGLMPITSVPVGIDCGTDCTEEFDFGTTITLKTPMAVPGSGFMGWSGAGCWGVDNCVTTLVENATITAGAFCIPGSRTFNFTGTIQTFTVPACGRVTLDASGAQGGAGSGFVGGLGAQIRGNFAMLAGKNVSIIVGGQGASIANGNGGGGGGSFIYVDPADALPLIAAAGGGGSSSNGGGQAPGGSATETPTAATIGSASAAGGTGGNGGTGGTEVSAGTPGTGGGGAGWLTNGMNGNGVTFGAGGGAPRNGGTAGAAGTNGVIGGFGGGGGSAGISGSSGGGGGFNGGGGGNSWNAGISAWGSGGGGGSYNGGTDPVNTANIRSGNGVVIITWAP